MLVFYFWCVVGEGEGDGGLTSMGSSSSSMMRPLLSTVLARSSRVSLPRLWQYQNTKSSTALHQLIFSNIKCEQGVAYRRAQD